MRSIDRLKLPPRPPAPAMPKLIFCALANWFSPFTGPNHSSSINLASLDFPAERASSGLFDNGGRIDAVPPCHPTMDTGFSPVRRRKLSSCRTHDAVPMVGTG